VGHSLSASEPAGGREELIILALADLHGAPGAGPGILDACPDFDAIVLAGDVTRFFMPSQVGPMVAPFIETGRPVLAVAGNCDGLEGHRALERLGCSVAGRGVTVGDGAIGFCGVPSGPPHYGQTWELSESELAAWLELGHRDIAAAGTKVLVSHAPPAGTHMPSSGELIPGSTAVRDGALRYGFDLILCGHIHEARSVTRLDDTVTVVNPGPARAGHYGVIGIGRDRIAVRLLTLGAAAGPEVAFPLPLTRR